MISDEQIYRYFCGDIKIGDMYRSPLPEKWRKRDTANSFGLYYYDDTILWKDFGLADQRGYNAINLVMYMRDCSYGKAAEIVETEIRRNYQTRPFVELEKGSRITHNDLPFVEYDYLNEFELRYWDRYGITAEELETEDIYGLRGIRWGNGVKQFSAENDPAYVYVFHTTPISWKIYRPLSKTQKFRQWNIEGVVEGLNSLLYENQFSPAKIGILTSSTKDRMVIKKLGYASVNPTAEGAYTALIQRWPVIKPLAERWMVMYDADDAGWNTSQVIADHLNIEAVDMRGKLSGEKDFSDYIDKHRGNHSYEQLKQIIDDNIRG